MRRSACINRLRITGSIIEEKGNECSLEQMPEQQMITLSGTVLLSHSPRPKSNVTANELPLWGLFYKFSYLKVWGARFHFLSVICKECPLKGQGTLTTFSTPPTTPLTFLSLYFGFTPVFSCKPLQINNLPDNPCHMLYILNQFILFSNPL